MRPVPAGAAVATAALLLAACGSAADATGTGGSSPDGGTEAGGQTVRLWLNGEDTPQEMVDYAVAEFEAAHPGVTVEFERQQWTGLVEKLTTSLSSNDSPDVVELGNTQAQAFEAAGALHDLTDKKEELGGDDLLTSLVEAGTYDDRFYGVPYYAGARVVFYRTDHFEEAGLEVPTTLEEFQAAGAALKQANADVPGYSGIFFPGKYWYAALPFVWESGGEIAVQDGDTWDAQLSSPGSVEGLRQVQQIMATASGAPVDGDESQDYLAFCNGEVGMLMGPGWKIGQIVNEDDGCPELEGSIGAFPLPGSEPGTTAPAFLGGSNLAVSAGSEDPELAYELVKVLTSDGYQEQFAELGLLPAKVSLLEGVGGSEAAEAQAAAAANSRFVPSSERWAGVEASTVLPDMLVAIAGGADVEAEAARADEAIEALLNG
ncbi:extracellular solute-binding protein [Aquipuribacter hungaricus]|uniref:Extracellular solute-binding protein n=1 Tax=Aquipuribacter hungaricus TaxID=545624 RepID=A0ABV7WC78_9MICO